MGNSLKKSEFSSVALGNVQILTRGELEIQPGKGESIGLD